MLWCVRYRSVASRSLWPPMKALCNAQAAAAYILCAMEFLYCSWTRPRCPALEPKDTPHLAAAPKKDAAEFCGALVHCGVKILPDPGECKAHRERSRHLDRATTCRNQACTR